VLVLLSYALLAAAPDPDVNAAEAAFANSRYDVVLPALDRAQAHPLTFDDQRRAWELRAVACAAFDRSDCAVEAYRHLLGFAADYTPTKRVSPKLLELLEQAKGLGALAPAPEPVEAAPEKPRDAPVQTRIVPSEPEPQTVASLTVIGPDPRRVALIGGAVVLAVSAVVAIVLVAAATPHAPATNLGMGTLR